MIITVNENTPDISLDGAVEINVAKFTPNMILIYEDPWYKLPDSVKKINIETFLDIQGELSLFINNNSHCDIRIGQVVYP